jgi:hypothetical protein
MLYQFVQVLNSDTKDASFILKPPSLKEVELNRRPPRGSTLVFACFLFYLFFHKKASLWVLISREIIELRRLEHDTTTANLQEFPLQFY